eukprot:12090508-Alexandrium_andersonii.AAC.1
MCIRDSPCVVSNSGRRIRPGPGGRRQLADAARRRRCGPARAWEGRESGGGGAAHARRLPYRPSSR